MDAQLFRVMRPTFHLKRSVIVSLFEDLRVPTLSVEGLDAEMDSSLNELSERVSASDLNMDEYKKVPSETYSKFQTGSKTLCV